MRFLSTLLVLLFLTALPAAAQQHATTSLSIAPPAANAAPAPLATKAQLRQALLSASALPSVAPERPVMQHPAAQFQESGSRRTLYYALGGIAVAGLTTGAILLLTDDDTTGGGNGDNGGLDPLAPPPGRPPSN